MPYRCFYSKNIDNLFMAGRCISVTHEALGTVRVMKTCGMMGEVVGRAASICVEQDCLPRDVYERYWPEMDTLLKLPGKAYRKTVNDKFVIPDDAFPLAGAHGPPTGLNPEKLAGIVIDDTKAEKSAGWTPGTGLKGYVGWSYLYSGNNSGATIRFSAKAPETGRYEVRLAYLPHENRGPTVPVSVQTGKFAKDLKINMKDAPPLKDSFISLGQFDVQKDDEISVTIGTRNAGGNAHADAVQIVRVKQ